MVRGLEVIYGHHNVIIHSLGDKGKERSREDLIMNIGKVSPESLQV